MHIYIITKLFVKFYGWISTTQPRFFFFVVKIGPGRSVILVDTKDPSLVRPIAGTALTYIEAPPGRAGVVVCWFTISIPQRIRFHVRFKFVSNIIMGWVAHKNQSCF